MTARVSPKALPTVEELEHVLAADAYAILLLASAAGEPVGSGLGRASSVPGSLYAMVRVVPEQRRRGVGTALLETLRAHASGHGFTGLWGRVDAGDEAALAFVRRHGFDEAGREHEARLDLRAAPTAEAAPPEGIEIVSLADRPELARAAHDVERAAIGDVPVEGPLAAAPFERWRAENLEGPGALPSACVVALAGGDVVGYAGLSARGGEDGTAEHLHTAVRREWRGRGIATALKRAQIEWARAAGFRRLVTTNDAPNAPMRAVNEKLGYRSAPASIQVAGPAVRSRDPSRSP